MKHLFVIATSIFTMVSASALAQKKSNVFQPNIPELLKNKQINVVNRTASIAFKDNKFTLHLDAQPSAGFAWFDNKEFSTGTIEFDAKGRNKQQASFVGFAFHSIGNAHDAIYLRPFNFQANSELSRSHSVQYISYPGHDWDQLRKTAPGKYENAINPPPAPDSWFHVKMIVSASDITVFVNNSSKPCLRVDKLNQRTTGGFGFFVGNGSDGDFANLKIVSN